MVRKKKDERYLLLSIRKPYSELILAGKKKFELRKRVLRLDCEYALIYETSPTKAIVGYFRIRRVIHDSKESLWKIVTDKSCVDLNFFMDYYKNSMFAVAIEIGNSKRFDKPMSLLDIGIGYAPQDYAYVESSEVNSLIRE